MLQSLKQALLDNCRSPVVQDVLGKALQEGVHGISLRYSKLQPSEQWQARLAADVWFVAETCRLVTQPLEGANW